MAKKKLPGAQLGFDLTEKQYVVIHRVGGMLYYRATSRRLAEGETADDAKKTRRTGHGWTTALWRAEVVTAPPAGFGWGDLTPA